MSATGFSPGELVRARGREWVVLASDETLTLRPLSGSEEDVELILPGLESEPVDHAVFDPPKFERTGGREAALLLRDALRLSLRRGAGPFRGAGRINFEPRAYQLGPLIMALRQEIVRLLIADDVGIGKTIEAGLILREMLDRGEIDRFAVLCPPHLVDQWMSELEDKFALRPTAVTASDAARLERDIVGAESVFDAHPFTVVSLDFIKSEKRVDDFERACPDFVVVDEAHAAVTGGRTRHLRFKLLQRVARRADRHLVLLTATPHSGDEAAFYSLLGLLRPEFAGIGEAHAEERRRLRERLAAHFIQRRRRDIEAWREPGLFPERETAEVSYRLGGPHEKLFNDVLDYCVEVVESEVGERQRRLAFWGTLALMRCVGSSPAAALRALRNRAVAEPEEAEIQAIAASTLDDEEQSQDDLEPSAAIEDPRLAGLVQQAEKLTGEFRKDPKYRSLVGAVRKLVDDDFSPVIFCRYIATAKAVAGALQADFREHMVEAVTGELPSEDREARVEELGAEDRRILVATDCLSEGINLQNHFDAVIHYDLSWNPTRHQQREGRVDRFGQKRDVVRAVLLYGENNPVDGAVLDVILRKARAIERQTGVRVPMPDEGGSLTKALMSAVMLRAHERRQLAFDFAPASMEEAKRLDLAWTNASERERESRSIFAQHGMKLEDVAPEWEATRKAIGDFSDVERFVERAMLRLGAGLEKVKGGYRAPIHLAPTTLRERFEAEGLAADGTRSLKVAFEPRPKPGFMPIHRAHPLPGIIAETFLELALEERQGTENDPAALPRCGVWETPAVATTTWLLLLRIRHRIDSRGRLGTRFALAEEAGAIAVEPTSGRLLESGEAALALLDGDAGSVPDRVRDAQLAKAEVAAASCRELLERHARERAEKLSYDHTKFRRALGSEAATRVSPVLPVDIIGLYVLLPRV